MAQYNEPIGYEEPGYAYDGTTTLAASCDLTVTSALAAAADLILGGTTHDATADLTVTSDLAAAADIIEPEPEPTGISGGWAPTRIIPRPVIHQATAAVHIYATLVADATLDPAGTLRRLLEDELVLLDLL